MHNSRSLFFDAVDKTREHGVATRQVDVVVQVHAEVNVTLHNGGVDSLVYASTGHT